MIAYRMNYGKIRIRKNSVNGIAFGNSLNLGRENTWSFYRRAGKRS